MRALQSAGTVADATARGGAPQLVADSSNLSYPSEDGSGHGDDASSSRSLSLRTEEFSVELAEVLTVADHPSVDHSLLPREEGADMSLQDFLSALKQGDLNASEAPASPDKPPTRKSEFRTRFASQRPSAAQNLNLKLKLNPDGPRSQPADASAETSSQESPAKPPFLPASPRQVLEKPAMPRSDRRQRTSHRQQMPTEHSRSESLDSIPEGSGHVKPQRPSTRRELEKTTTRRVIPRTTSHLPAATALSTPPRPANPKGDIEGFDEAWTDLGRLADQILELTAAGPKPLTPSTEEKTPLPEKPPADH